MACKRSSVRLRYPPLNNDKPFREFFWKAFLFLRNRVSSIFISTICRQNAMLKTLFLVMLKEIIEELRITVYIYETSSN